MTNELLEGSAVSLLRLSDQRRVVDAVCLPSHVAPRNGVLGTAASSHPITRIGSFANRDWYSPRFGRHVVVFSQSLPEVNIPGLQGVRRGSSQAVSRNYRGLHSSLPAPKPN